jgi:hypothetical protein
MTMWRGVPITLSILLLSSCIHAPDVETINDYVTIVNTASLSFDAIAKDFADSCLAARELRLTRIQDLRLAPELQPASDPKSSRGPYDVATDVVQCQSASDVSQQWAKRNRILVGYVRSLGAIAGVDTRPAGFDNFAAQLTNIGAMKDIQAQPFADLATTIASVLISGKRDADLRRFVHEADPPLQAASQSLTKFVSTDYRVILDSERVFLDSKFRTALREQLASSRADSIAIYNERQEWMTKRAQIDKKISAISDYNDAITTIADINHEMMLVSDRNGSLSDLYATAQEYVNALGGDVAALYSTYGEE